MFSQFVLFHLFCTASAGRKWQEPCSRNSSKRPKATAPFLLSNCTISILVPFHSIHRLPQTQTAPQEKHVFEPIRFITCASTIACPETKASSTKPLRHLHFPESEDLSSVLADQRHAHDRLNRFLMYLHVCVESHPSWCSQRCRAQTQIKSLCCQHILAGQWPNLEGKRRKMWSRPSPFPNS